MMRQLTANDGSFIPKLELPLLGVGGSFVLPSTPGRVLLIAGGIGITPFLAHLQAIASAPKGEDDSAWEVQLLVSTREPHVTLDLLKRSLSASPSPSSNLNLDLTVHLFSPSALTLGLDFPTPLGVNVHLSSHVGRITPEAIAQAVKQGEGKSKVYLCGPPEFERSVQRGLRAAGVEEKEVETENFNY